MPMIDFDLVQSDNMIMLFFFFLFSRYAWGTLASMAVVKNVALAPLVINDFI